MSDLVEWLVTEGDQINGVIPPAAIRRGEEV